MKSILLAIFLAIATYSVCTAGLSIDLFPGETRCIGQELDQEDSAAFVFNTLATQNKKDNERSVTASVSDPNGKSLFEESIVIGSPRQFRLNVAVRGVFQMCVDMQAGRSPLRVHMDVDFKSRSGRSKSDPSKPVSKEDMPTVEDKLKAAEEALADLGREIDFARRQELLLKEAGETTQSRIQWFGFFSIVVLATTTLWQLWYLRRFFASKKLL